MIYTNLLIWKKASFSLGSSDLYYLVLLDKSFSFSAGSSDLYHIALLDKIFFNRMPILKKKTVHSNSENYDSIFTLNKADKTWKQLSFIYRNSSNRKIVYACQTVLCPFSLKCVQLSSLSCRSCDSFRSKLEEKVETLIFVAKIRVTSPILSF